jgi:hypothetical protein
MSNEPQQLKVLTNHFEQLKKTHPEATETMLFHAGAAAACTLIFHAGEVGGGKAIMKVIDHLLGETVEALGLKEELDAEIAREAMKRQTEETRNAKS